MTENLCILEGSSKSQPAPAETSIFDACSNNNNNMNGSDLNHGAHSSRSSDSSVNSASGRLLLDVSATTHTGQMNDANQNNCVGAETQDLNVGLYERFNNNCVIGDGRQSSSLEDERESSRVNDANSAPSSRRRSNGGGKFVTFSDEVIDRSHNYRMPVDTRRDIFVGLIPPHTSREEILGRFSPYGFIDKCVIKYGGWQIYAFLKYSKPEYAAKAVKSENGRLFKNSFLHIEYVKNLTDDYHTFTHRIRPTGIYTFNCCNFDGYHEPHCRWNCRWDSPDWSDESPSEWNSPNISNPPHSRRRANGQSPARVDRRMEPSASRRQY